MPMWEITQERRIRWIWQIRAEDADAALRRIRVDEEIAVDEEFLEGGDYQIRRVTPDG